MRGKDVPGPPYVATEDDRRPQDSVKMKGKDDQSED